MAQDASMRAGDVTEIPRDLAILVWSRIHPGGFLSEKRPVSMRCSARAWRKRERTQFASSCDKRRKKPTKNNKTEFSTGQGNTIDLQMEDKQAFNLVLDRATQTDDEESISASGEGM